MPHLEIAGAALHYQIEGAGESLALIHGVGSDLTSWDGVIEALCGDYQILRVDLRGHGKSEKTPGPYSLRMFRDDLLSLFDHLSFTKIHLVGFSLGGIIAQRIAIDARERLASLSVVSSVADRTAEEKQRVVKRAELLEKEGARAHLANASKRWFTDVFLRAHPEVVERRRQKSLQNDPDCYAAAYRVLAENDLADELHKIVTPTLAITGECDAGSPPRMSRLIADRVQSGQVAILPAFKHAVLLEAPEQIALLLEQFFDGVRNA